MLPPLPDDRLAALAAGVRERLANVLVVTDDFAAMTARAEAVADELERHAGALAKDEVREVQDFLHWLVHGSYVFLGARSLSFVERDGATTVQIDPGSGLGLLRDEQRSHYAAPTDLREIAEPVRGRLVGGALLSVARTAAYAPVHRHVRMDYVGVKRLDDHGRICGEHRLLGLLTSKAYAEESAEIPILRQRLAQILRAERIVPGSHDYKEIVAIFNSMPKTELFPAPVEAVRADIETIRAHGAKDVHVTVRPDVLERGAAVMVIMPRDKFSGALRARIQEALAARFGGQVLDYHLALGEGDQARLHFFLEAPREHVRRVRWEDLRHEIAELARGWDDRLAERLIALHGAARGAELTERYGRILPEQYKAATEIPAAVNDIRHLETLRGGAAASCDVANPIGGDDRFTALRLYLREQLVLSDVVPMLEDLGLRVFAESALTIPVLDGGAAYLHTFLVQTAAGARVDVRRDGDRLLAALTAVRDGAVESDALNQLVLAAALGWQEVDLLRTYCNYGFQIGAAPSRRALTQALVRHPRCAAALLRYFAARFQPGLDRGEAGPARQAFVASLDDVDNIGEDRALRALCELVDATVRSNFYAVRAQGGDYVAIKLDCARIETLPKPRPLFEIYVQAAHMEGVHLRAGRIARGGIRFSDRHDDFRSEILGLMKTQTVKNAVIVPVGAKGGFIVKRAAGPDAVAAAYTTLIRGMLDLTDNVVDADVCRPPGLVCYDEPDPYLVVAADKGTATFSDLANDVAAEYRFWLGDAFASGGSHGYDHKRLGITARGAWECIAHHFHECGVDVGGEAFTVAGIGDMSGDVFGNAMLLSPTLRLRAAFDHRHIFLDPDPDPAVSYAERARLFALPRSSWADYRRDALGPGATIVARDAKRVLLTREVQALLEVSDDALDGESLIRAMLRVRTDLLFNGGIGTYVKARGETLAEVGDTANASVRVNGAELRARVVGEGGNLGITQRGRIEYALAGGAINTDAIDNSAGVDMSDHEVNLKIALQPLVASGALSPTQRNALLEEVTEDVAGAVLAHNRDQARVLSRDQRRSRQRLFEFRELMAAFEREGLLDRALESLPDRETLRGRRADFLGLTRPELAVLLAYAKMHCTRAVAASPLVDDPFLEEVLLRYFPTALATRHRDAIRRHRLRRELIATTLTNEVIDLMGTTFVTRTVRDTGANPADVVRAFVVVDALAHARDLAARAAATGAETESRLLGVLLPAVERVVRWLLATYASLGAIGPLVARFRRAAAEATRLPPAEEARRQARVAELGAGAPADVAAGCVAADWLREGLEIVDIAAAAGVADERAARAYWRVGDVVDFTWLRAALEGAAAEDRWERRAAESLLAELDDLRRQLAAQLVPEPDLDAAAHAFEEAHAATLARVRGLLDDLRSGGRVTLAAMIVVVRELARLEEDA
ncbi:MAG: NAD-glutamate dehydrogenase [Deltaproteobacteria bacterium]|nr:MAG: NAD-glutamate dehydrogenase [Deltaproteobacteria bacterium]